MKTTLSYILLFFSVVALGQNKAIDSLQSVLQKKNDVVAKVNTLNALAFEHKRNNPDTALYFANEALSLAQTKDYKLGIAEAYLNIGRIDGLKSDAYSALKNLNQALKIYDEMYLSLKDKSAIQKQRGNVYNEVGKIWIILGNYPEALRTLLIALKIREELNDKLDVSYTQNNIGILYYKQVNYPEALKYYSASLKKRQELGDEIGIANSLNNIANIYSSQGKNLKAMEYYSDAFKNFKELNDKFGMANAYFNIGIIMADQNKISQSMPVFYDALKLYEETENKEGMTNVYLTIGSYYLEQKNMKEAIFCANKAMAISKEVGNWENLKDSYLIFAKLDSAQGNYKQSLENYKLGTAYKDSLFNQASTEKIVQQQMQYDFDKKEAATKAEQDKKQAIAVAEIQKQKLVRNFSFAGIFIVLLIGGYGFYRFRKNKLVENQQSLLNERLRISRELHDDMGSTLSSISVYSEVAKNRAIKNENETEVLQKIGTASRELIEKMSDIVWSLNPNNENFEQLKNRMMAFAAMMLTPKGILFEFEIDDEVKSTAIAPEQRKNIFLIYKEAINNIVKYSEASSVKVKVKARPNVDSYGRVKENKLSLEVIDNGKGFDTDNVVAYNGNGLKNMKARAEEIKALFNVTSRINEGTGIELSFNV